MTMNTLPSILVAGMIGAGAICGVNYLLQDSEALINNPTSNSYMGLAIFGFITGALVQLVLRITKIS